MTQFREFTFHANDLDNDGFVDGDGLNAPVIGNFPLEPGDFAKVFLKDMEYLGTDGAGGGSFADPVDGSVIYVSDTNQLSEGDPMPEPQDGNTGQDPDDTGVDVIGTEDADNIQVGVASDGVDPETGTTDFADTVDGLGGDDWIFGGGGNDEILGGAGNDVLGGNNGQDILTAGSGNDILLGGAGDDSLNGQGGRGHPPRRER